MKSIVVGLTGQTGAGKSTVASFAEAMGCRIVNCYTVAREAHSPGSDCLKRVAELFGSDIIDDMGCCRRTLLAERAFADKEKTELLNSVTHPWIIRRSQEYIEQYSIDFDGMVILDAPLLYESGGDALCVRVIAVTAPIDVRLARIMNRDGISREHAMLRINAQKDDEYYTSKADYIIDGSKSLDEVEDSLKKILEAIKANEV